MPDWFATTLSVLAGGGLTILAGWLTDRRASQREQNRVAEERRERFLLRSNDFQRETLLALQEASQRLGRSTGAMFHQDVVAHRTTGVWQRQQFGEELSNGHLQHMTETLLLASRVRDDEVRQLAGELRDRLDAVLSASDEAAAERLLGTAMGVHEALIERTGMLIREIDEIESPGARRPPR